MNAAEHATVRAFFLGLMGAAEDEPAGV